MGILCILAGHKPVPSNIWNDGYYFSRCSHCDCELIGRGGAWHRIPRGYKVVWRPRTQEACWTPSRPVNMDGARLTDLVQAGQDNEAWPDTAAAYGRAGSVVEGFHIRAAAG